MKHLEILEELRILCVSVWLCVCVWLWEGSQEIYTGDQHQVSFSLVCGGQYRFFVCVCENVCVSVWL